MELIGWIVLGLVGAVILALALIGALGTLRGTPIRRVGAIAPDNPPPAVSDPRFEHTIGLLVRAPLHPGHHVELLQNGDGFFPRFWKDLRAAERSITIQFYYAKPGRVADTLREILCERARDGVRVLLLHDAIGSKDLPDRYWKDLEAAGVQVAALRRLRLRALDRLNSRAHSRAVVIDRTLGYTGGFGISDQWLGDGHRSGEWRELNVRFTGPAAGQLQAAFADVWAEATGLLLSGEDFFPDPREILQDPLCAALLHASPEIGSTVGERFLTFSIASARERLYVWSGYFTPDDDLVALLVHAAERKVDVRILTANQQSDVPLAWWGGRARYEELLEGGVRIWEFQPAMMHAKGFVIDGTWATVGAMNFDSRSMALNDETNLLVLNPEFGRMLERVFRDDLRHAREIGLEEFRQRPWSDRAREQGAHLLSRLL